MLGRKFLIASRKLVFFKPKGIVWDDLIRKYPVMQKFIQ